MFLFMNISDIHTKYTEISKELLFIFVKPTKRTYEMWSHRFA